MAKDLVKKIPKRKEHAFVIALKGDLGGGKTTFIQGMAKGLGIKEKILSPTFNILKKYGNFYHFDCYRIEKPKEILDLGFKKIIQDPKNIVVVEWADKIKKIIPKHALWLNFKFVDKSKREINMIK
ncbi:hypothetical protein AMJ47_03795 [Parcubacteria bacterium DG_72]|nr:MAG: hypothetical protein AMJ47_03795 [Parcubacteria bacterium DG_72]